MKRIIVLAALALASVATIAGQVETPAEQQSALREGWKFSWKPIQQSADETIYVGVVVPGYENMATIITKMVVKNGALYQAHLVDCSDGSVTTTNDQMIGSNGIVITRVDPNGQNEPPIVYPETGSYLEIVARAACRK